MRTDKPQALYEKKADVISDLELKKRRKALPGSVKNKCKLRAK
jgi:hypothetical protein